MTNPETAGVKPVAWMYHDEEGIPHLQFGRRPSGFVKRNGWTETPLYAHPAPASNTTSVGEGASTLSGTKEREYLALLNALAGQIHDQGSDVIKALHDAAITAQAAIRSGSE